MNDTATQQPMDSDEIDGRRRDPDFARARIERFLPDPNVRKACLSVIADTIERAHALGRSCWGVTLRKSKKIHLNVGRCLAIGIYEGRISLGLHESELSDELRAFLLERVEKRGSFDSLKGTWTCSFPADRFVEIWSRAERAYWRFVEGAAGTAKQTPWFYSHSPGIVVYLRETLNRPSLPDPVYDWTARRPLESDDDDDDGVPDPAQGGSVTNRLTQVEMLDDIRTSLAQFNAQALQAKDRARTLLRSTTFWVFDPTTGKFGPSKFVGFAGMDFAAYEAAMKGEITGARFDGTATRTAIEKASGMDFSPDPHLPEMLQRWGEALLGAGIFDGLVEGSSRWKFLALPAPECRYWKIAPGGKAAFWEENRDSGIIAIGWGQAGDPRAYRTKEELEALYSKVFDYTKDQSQSSVRAVRCFIRDIKPGDIIVANQGQSRVVGRGVVLGPAEFRTKRNEWANCLPVHWFDAKGQDVPRQKSWFTTIASLTVEVYEALFGATGGGEVVEHSDDPGIEGGDGDEGSGPDAPPGIYDYLRSRKFHFPAELVSTYLLSLKTKPFVVLSGISGTGKTKLAQAVAEWAGAESRLVEEEKPANFSGQDASAWSYQLQPYNFKHRKVTVARAQERLFDLPPEGTRDVIVRYAGASYQGFLGAINYRGNTYWELRFAPPLVERLTSDAVPGDFIVISAEKNAADEQVVSIRKLGKERRTKRERIERHEFVSVRPDWLDGKEVLGFYNVLTEVFSSRPFLDLLLRAHRDPSKPHFAILDEMNLARVEHYFADLLSATESRTVDGDKLRQEPLHLHDRPKCLPLVKLNDWEEPEKCASCPAQQKHIDACSLHLDGVQFVPPKLKVPVNVYVTGTVNIDETTHMFSPKVLDRANVIEFNEVDLLGYGNAAAPGEFVLKDGRINLSASTVACQEHFHQTPEEVRKVLTTLNQILAEYNLHFGYRVANEIALYVKNAVEHVGFGATATALDLQLLQKVLPKFHGSKQKLLGPLWRVLLFTIFGRDLGSDYADDSFARIESAIRKGEDVISPAGGDAVKPSMPRSAAKLVRMLRTLRAQGFVSFIE